MDHDNIHSDSRLAGEVQRYHTWPTLRNQTVAEHTWQMMRIWHHLFGAMPPEVSTAILWHDAGELRTGDVPYMAKKDAPTLKVALDRLEEKALVEMGAPAYRTIDREQRIKIKLCDLIEMNEFGIYELARGNMFAEPIAKVTHDAIKCKLMELSDPDDRAAVNKFMARVYQNARIFYINFAVWEDPVVEPAVEEKVA
jgi:hypothetical protein